MEGWTKKKHVSDIPEAMKNKGDKKHERFLIKISQDPKILHIRYEDQFHDIMEGWIKKKQASDIPKVMKNKGDKKHEGFLIKISQDPKNLTY